MWSAKIKKKPTKQNENLKTKAKTTLLFCYINKSTVTEVLRWIY